MNTKKVWKLFALITVVALLFAACGAKEEPAPETTEAPAASQEATPLELGLTDFTLTASIWSSANGASVDLTATPIAYADGLTATFVVRLEGEDVANNPCEWNGTAFTGYADLNAEDGYCYYLVLAGADGTETTVELNTPTNPKDTALINLAASLDSFCTVTVTDASYADDKLTITEGTLQIQVPQIGSGSDALTCTAVDLILNLDGGALTKVALEANLADSVGDNGNYAVDLANTVFSVPAMEGDHQINLAVVAHLSDGTTLTDDDSTAWFYSDGTVHLTVG